MWEVLTGAEADVTRPQGDAQMSFFTALLLFYFICHVCKTLSWRRWQCVRVLLCFLLLWGAWQDVWQCGAAVTREVMQVSPAIPSVPLVCTLSLRHRE